MPEHQDQSASPTGEPFPDIQHQLEFTPDITPGTDVFTLADNYGPSRPPSTLGNLQAKVDLMLLDEEVLRRLNTRDKVLEPRPVGS